MAARALRSGDVVRVRGESWVVHRQVAGIDTSIVEVVGSGSGNRGTRASFLLPHEPIETLPASAFPRLLRPRAWQRLARSVLAEATSSYDSLRSPRRANLALLPYQLEPALAVVRGVAARILIADEVGLGKTIQAGLIISELNERQTGARVLVITPAGLRDQWQSELRARFDIESTRLDATALARAGGQWSGNPWSAHGVIVTSLDYVKRPEVVRALEALVWDVLVFDEAHALAGRSDRATVASLLAQRARTLVLLTATPHSGDGRAFARLAELGDILGRFPLLVFRRTRLDVGLMSRRKTRSLRIRPTPAERAVHDALLAYTQLVWRQSSTSSGARLAMTVLARRACSSAWSLARSIETRLRLLSIDETPDTHQLALPFADPGTEDGAPANELSAPGLPDRYEERRWLDHLLRLARLAELDESKLAALARLLRRSREPAIVFTEYRDTLDRIARYLQDVEHTRIHGGLTRGERQEALAKFGAGPVDVLLATDAASEGLNLHHRCRLVINLELPWTPVRLEQRIGRVERLGQTKQVHAVHLLAAHTCEERSVAALIARAHNAASALEAMRGSLFEHHVAGVVFGQQPLPALHPPSNTLPRGVIVGDLRAAAREEAARLERARALTVDATCVCDRPGVAVLRRRRRSDADYWAFRVAIEDSELHTVWDVVIGLRTSSTFVPPVHRDLRVSLESVATIVEPIMATAAEAALAKFVSALQPSLSLAIARERAIEEAIGARRARVAAALLQPGLFDRRAERAVASQSATLDEAVDRCRRRLAELAHKGHPRLDRPRMVFGLVRR
jgi:superfamily II DNA or RNA helicase